uniref:Uncharacterized protein n=1 Tax=Sphaerodactylus townsendi TaxID=933632 RepID=A0ACB8E5N8_9SAUR
MWCGVRAGPQWNHRHPGQDERDQTPPGPASWPSRDAAPFFIRPPACLRTRSTPRRDNIDVPLKLCVTSNLKGQTVPSIELHHFGFWYNTGHPVVLCTDDKGVFATDLSREYQLVAETFQLSREQVWHLSYHAIDYVFAGARTKAELKEKWNKLKPSLLSQDAFP